MHPNFRIMKNSSEFRFGTKRNAHAYPLHIVIFHRTGSPKKGRENYPLPPRILFDAPLVSQVLPSLWLSDQKPLAPPLRSHEHYHVHHLPPLVLRTLDLPQRLLHLSLSLPPWEDGLYSSAFRHKHLSLKKPYPAKHVGLSLYMSTELAATSFWLIPVIGRYKCF
ncbi:hypothetical protein AB205_0018230 [Aquarana catesbeiana]|uniref:Uncharacterized protein n=1 Tax=Aquarana catesbeiana TaxID=8400 RepID=A0A2G9RMM5_AQUCT|nr:hypothetical protein AB205_0018230 [Aquarana catesbeiana]